MLQWDFLWVLLRKNSAVYESRVKTRRPVYWRFESLRSKVN